MGCLPRGLGVGKKRAMKECKRALYRIEERGEGGGLSLATKEVCGRMGCCIF